MVSLPQFNTHRYMRSMYILIVSLFVIVGCADDSTSSDILPPSNLEIEVNVGDTQNGEVEIIASANNANFFEFELGDGSDVINDTQGTITYKYADEGEYTITVRAHTTPEVFITEQTTVSIEIDNSIDIPGYSTPLSYAGYNLVWNDEFDGTSLSADWTYEIGTGSNGWGNNELQYYREQNTTVSDGYLTIEAREETFSGQNYTSSRIITENRQEFKFGRIDIRAVLPEGQGIWPALWMLGANFREIGWPKCGEIDIMEKIGGAGRENNVFGTLHWDNNGSHACTCGQGSGYTLSNGTFGDEFHVFSLIWDASEISWYVDDEHYKTIDITPADLDEFREKFFFIFNIAVGGNLPGSPDASTQFPQQMIVDYIRVFQEQ